MNYTTASCGHSVPAVGAPGSLARQRVESRPCVRPRCQSKLPAHFSDDECDAWIYLRDCDVREWTVDLLTRTVADWSGDAPVMFTGLVEFAKVCGWRPTKE